MEPTPQDPLDRVVLPTSNNWIPNLKMPSLGHIGKPLHEPTIRKRPLLVKLRGRAQPVDVVAYRQLQRVRLMNAKARHMDDLIKDAIELNDEEQRYLKRREELQRLEATFQAGVLAFFTKGVVKQAEADLMEEVIRNDPDIASFDDKTSEIIESAEQLTRLQKQNESERQDLRDNLGEIDEMLEDLIARVELADEMEQITALVEQRNMLPTAGLSEEEFEGEISGEESEAEISGEEDIDDIEGEVNRNLDEELRQAERYTDIGEKTEELMEQVEKQQSRTRKPKTIAEAQALLHDIEKAVGRLNEITGGLRIADPRLRNLARRVGHPNPRINIRTTHERNPRPTALRRFRANLIEAIREARLTAPQLTAGTQAGGSLVGSEATGVTLGVGEAQGKIA